MTQWVELVGELPAELLVGVLGLVMMLDAMPLIGVLVPGDVAVLAATGVNAPVSGALVFLTAIGGCVAGWSLSFFAGRHFGYRLRRSRVGGWIGEARWSAAQGAVGHGGGRIVVVAPFLPVLNALVPLAAGGLRMPYRRFVACATLGSALWAGLYVLLGVAARSLGGLLPGGSLPMAATVAIGFLVGWIVLVGARRRLRATSAPRPADKSEPVGTGGVVNAV